MSKKQVNIITSINSASNISKQTIDGKDHFLIKNVVPIIDNIVMNGVFYSESEIESSYQTMNGKLMPYNHPKISDQYVSANSPQAINNWHIGAWVSNASKSGEKVLLDMKIDIDYASRVNNGYEVINRLEGLMNGTESDPIHISTGLFHYPEESSGNSRGKNYSVIARNIEFDHVAILPRGVDGAGTPSEGVGIFSHNGLDIEREVVLLESSMQNDESTNKIKKGIVSKIFNFLINSDLSFDDISNQFRIKLKETYPNEYIYIILIYNDRFAYEIDSKVFIQKYHIEDRTVVQFDGEPVLGVIKTELEEIKNNQEVDMTAEEMKNLLVNSLTPLSEAVNKLTEDNKTLSNELALVKSAITANADKETAAIKQEIKEKMGYSDVVVNSLSPEALSEIYSKLTASKSLNTGRTLADNSDIEDPSYILDEDSK